jgi:3-methyladenine DNA glycosylase AlkD
VKTLTHKYTKEVEDTLTRLALKTDNANAEKLKKYIGTRLYVLGMNSGSQADACKKGFSFYSDNKEKTYLVFHEIYRNSSHFEAKNLAFIFLDRNHKHIPLKTQLKTLPQWVKQVDNWAHSDGLSKYLTRLLEHNDTKEKMLDILKKWNGSKNLWERRQSLVSLFYYARTKKTHPGFDLAKQLIFALLTDKEYYVQKAVGWALRESYNVYPKQTYAFIKENIKSISPTAFTTCLEKMTLKEKEHLKLIRKKK